jgi:hypothetical protein
VRCCDYSRGDGVLRRLLERANDTKRLVNAPAGRGLDPQDARPANRQRAGLVEDDGARPRKRLEREPPFHQDATARCARDACNIGDRGGEDQRTWCRCHKDGKPANRIVGEAPRDSGECERNGQKQEREPVRHPDGRRFGGLRCGRHPHDAGVGAFAFCCRCLKRKGLPCVDSPAAHRLALAPRDGYRLTGEGRLVKHCVRVREYPIDRHDLAGAHEKPVADRDVRNCNVAHLARGLAMGDARRAVD